MDLKEIEALIKLFEKAEISTLKIEEGDKKIKLEKNLAPVPNLIQMSGNGPASMAYAYNLPQAGGSQPVTAAASAEAADPKAEAGASQAGHGVDPVKGKEIKSPMVGVFYAAPSPDDPPYVSVGDKVKKGDVLCIVEAMKLMNEILAETDGEILEVCLENGDIVEYGQTMFRIE